jgi:hypothetical protein
MIIEYVSKAVQDEAQLAGERNPPGPGGATGPRGAPQACSFRRSDAAVGPAAAPPRPRLTIFNSGGYWVWSSGVW